MGYLVLQPWVLGESMSEKYRDAIGETDAVTSDFLVRGDGRRILMEGARILIKEWIPLAKNGVFGKVSGKEIDMAQKRVKQLDRVLSRPTPTGDNRN